MLSIFTNKLIPVAVVAALLGGTLGAFGTRAMNTEDMALNTAEMLPALEAPVWAAQDEAAPVAARNNVTYLPAPATRTVVVESPAPARTVYYTPAPRTATRARVATNHAYSSSPSTVRYEPRKRSFWDKHRDKLTVALGSGLGAALGGAFGGKKGALIGALAGGGGSALYTYKIRKRNRRY